MPSTLRLLRALGHGRGTRGNAQLNAPIGAKGASRLLRQHPVEYRRAVDTAYREAIFRLRYRSYRTEDVIAESSSERFTDERDEDANAFVYGIEKDGVLAASIRLHVVSREMPFSPGLAVFPDILGAMLDRGQSYVDPTRFVVDRSMSRMMGNLPFATVRLAAMAAEHFSADYILATVRAEHAPFYKRFFDMELLSEPRPYPSLSSPICIMAGRWEAIKQSAYTRVPDFDSDHRERVRLFGWSRLIGMGMSDAPSLNDNTDGSGEAMSADDRSASG